MKQFKLLENKGITLIALVITIIILIILAGVSLTLILGENGIITKVKDAKQKQDIARITEKLELLKGPVLIDKTVVNLNDYLQILQEKTEEYNINDIERVNENNVYAVLEGKYKFLITDTENGNVIITYEGLVGQMGTLDLTVIPYDGIYDSESHGIIVTCAQEGATIQYSSDGINYNSEKPTYTDIGIYTTYYKVIKPGYETLNNSSTVTIKCKTTKCEGPFINETGCTECDRRR